mmetsp:Transcript_4436/g.5501  ORF Transcript_4436/g.5501 Transcript_4436/m.5501 type:complete len:129 (+) Transcript_4436:250-636(+)
MTLEDWLLSNGRVRVAELDLWRLVLKEAENTSDLKLSTQKFSNKISASICVYYLPNSPTFSFAAVTSHFGLCLLVLYDFIPHSPITPSSWQSCYPLPTPLTFPIRHDCEELHSTMPSGDQQGCARGAS